MTHREKVDRFIEDMRERGVGTSSAAPPLFRLLWALGLEIPPPLFLGFLPLALAAGAFFGFFWGLFMAAFFLIWLVVGEGVLWGHAAIDLVWKGLFGLGVLAGGAFVAGLLFGLTMATYMRWKAARLALPSWDRYPAVSFPDDCADDF